MKGILDRHIESKINWSDINHIGVIGIDEIALKKGHKDYVTLITCRNDGFVKKLLLSLIDSTSPNFIENVWISLDRKCCQI